MSRPLLRTYWLIFLALVFTAGLSFASVELPYLLDEALMEAVPTPGFRFRDRPGGTARRPSSSSLITICGL